MNTIKFYYVSCYEVNGESVNIINFIFKIDKKTYNKTISSSKYVKNLEEISFDSFISNIYNGLNDVELKLFIENFENIYRDFSNYMKNHILERISNLNDILDSYKEEKIVDSLKYLKVKYINKAIQSLNTNIKYIENLVDFVYLKTSQTHQQYSNRLIELQKKKKILENELNS